MNTNHVDPNVRAMRERVRDAVARTPITDIHTHLYSPAFGPMLLRGIDALLTYHYLIAEMFRWRRDLSYEAFHTRPVRTQADEVWRAVFIEHSPVSESARGLLTSLQSFGLDTASRDITAFRAFFDTLSASDHINLAMKQANVNKLVMTNDPFDPAERAVWDKGVKPDSRFATALRIDKLFIDWPGAVKDMRAMGFKPAAALTPQTKKEVKRFLEHWIATMDPLYMMASLPPSFIVPAKTIPARVFEEVVLPCARGRGLAFAMMLGCKRQINPDLKLAGDGVATVSLDMVEHVARTHPDNKFLLTMLARENQHAAVIVSRKFRNILPFGCWWFVNSPSLIGEITRMRLEWLGLGMIPQHSDARVLDQIIYKWMHTKEIMADVLTEKYRDIERTGWRISDDELSRDIAGLFGENFWAFVGRKP